MSTDELKEEFEHQHTIRTEHARKKREISREMKRLAREQEDMRKNHPEIREELISPDDPRVEGNMQRFYFFLDEADAVCEADLAMDTIYYLICQTEQIGIRGENRSP